MSKKRERKNDFSEMRSAIEGLITELVRKQLSHAEWLERLSKHVYETEQCKRLTWPHVSELYGMVRGAERALFASDEIRWCHWYKDKFQTSEECQSDPDFSYQQIDSDKSRYCWRDSRKPF